jgi:hypothetical protein
LRGSDELPSEPGAERVPSLDDPAVCEPDDDRGAALRVGGGAGGGVADHVDPPLFEPPEFELPDPLDVEPPPEPDEEDEPDPDELDPLGTACPAPRADIASTAASTRTNVRVVR